MTTAIILLSAIIIFLLGVFCGAALIISTALSHRQREEKELEDEAGRD